MDRDSSEFFAVAEFDAFDEGKPLFEETEMVALVQEKQTSI